MKSLLIKLHVAFSCIIIKHLQPHGPHSHILMMGGGGPSDFFGSEILAKSVFFGSMKNAGMFLGCKKRIKGLREFWVC